tara:strand:+ start:184 stop:696 length:513 start_codon:yes stop_codon:yes gene_type:complete
MKAWLKDGVLGFIVFGISAPLLNYKSYIYGTWETQRLIFSIFKSFLILGISGLFFGWMIGYIIRNIKERKILYIPIIVFALHLLFTLFLPAIESRRLFNVSDNFIIIFAPLVSLCHGCSSSEMIIGNLYFSFLFAFISFIIVRLIISWIIGRNKSKKQQPVQTQPQVQSK